MDCLNLMRSMPTPVHQRARAAGSTRAGGAAPRSGFGGSPWAVLAFLSALVLARGGADAATQDDEKQQAAAAAAIEYLKSKGGRFQRFDAKLLRQPVEPFWSADLHNIQLVDAELWHLKQIKDLKYLSVGGNFLTDKGIAVLAEISQLTHLHLINLPDVTDRGVDKLADLAALERLTLNGVRVTDQGLKRFGQLKKLQHLNLEALP